MKHLTNLFDLTADEVAEILELAADLKAQFKSGYRGSQLQNRVLAQVFEKPSLRTRNSFEAAMIQLGGNGIFLTTAEAGMNGRESLADVARVLSCYSDVITLRTFSHQLIVDFASHASCPVINALSDERHPCQALTDLLTIKEALDGLDGRTLAFVGDGNNVAASLAVAAGHTGLNLVIASPVGYELSGDLVSEVKTKFPNASITLCNEPEDAVREADVVYTDVWASMGQEAESAKRQHDFAGFCVNGDLMSRAPSGCKFMHDLPAKRGLEVTDDVIDGPASIVFQQAENRMHLAKGLIAWLLGAEHQSD